MPYFIGSQPLNSQIYQPIISGGILCDFSTYFNGLLNVNVDFIDDGRGTYGVPTAGSPVERYDRYVGADYIGARITLTTPTFLYLDNWTISWSCNAGGNGTNDRLYYESGASLLECKVVTGSSDSEYLRLFLRNEAGATIADLTSAALKPFTSANADCTLTRVGDTITLTVNGVDEVLSTSIATGSLEVTTSSTISSQFFDFLGSIWDFDLNGILVPIDEGSGVIIRDSDYNVVGTLVDPSVDFWDNYLPYTDGSGGKAPNTGPMRLHTDNIEFIDSSTFDWSLQDFAWKIKTDAITTNNFGDRFYVFGCAGGDASVVVSIRAPVVNENRLQVLMKDDSNASFVSTGASLPDVSGEHVIEVIYTQSTSTIDIEIDGVNIFTDVVTITTGFTLDEYSFGGNTTGTSAIEMDFYYARMTVPSLPNKFGYINLTTRLPTESDPDGGEFVDTNGNVWTLTDRSNFGAYYPYYTEWNDSYLESDTLCAGNNLVTNNGIAVTNNGEFVQHTP